MMASKGQTKRATPRQVSEETQSEPTSFDASQSQDRQAAELQGAMKKNRQKTQQRRDQQKKEILSNHENRQAKLKRDIEECLKIHDANVRAARRPQFEQLIELARQKHALEERIEKCHSELEQIFLSTANQLQVVLNGRIEHLSE